MSSYEPTAIQSSTVRYKFFWFDVAWFEFCIVAFLSASEVVLKIEAMLPVDYDFTMIPKCTNSTVTPQSFDFSAAQGASTAG